MPFCSSTCGLWCLLNSISAISSRLELAQGCEHHFAVSRCLSCCGASLCIVQPKVKAVLHLSLHISLQTGLHLSLHINQAVPEQKRRQKRQLHLQQSLLEPLVTSPPTPAPQTASQPAPLPPASQYQATTGTAETTQMPDVLQHTCGPLLPSPYYTSYQLMQYSGSTWDVPVDDKPHRVSHAPRLSLHPFRQNIAFYGADDAKKKSKKTGGGEKNFPYQVGFFFGGTPPRGVGLAQRLGGWLACGRAYWPLAFQPSAMTSRHPYYCGHPHCRRHPPSWVGIQNATSADGVLP